MMDPFQSGPAPRVMAFLVFATLTSALALASSNPALTFAAIALAFLLVAWFWRPGTPQALLFSIGFQWLQATALLFSADLRGLSLSDPGAALVRMPSDLGTATWLSLAGLLAVGLGMRLAVGSQAPIEDVTKKGPGVVTYRIDRIFFGMVVAIALSRLALVVGMWVPGLSEPLQVLLTLRWGVYYVLADTVFRQRSGYPLLFLVFLFELVTGFLGFFGDFRMVVAMTALAALAQPGALRGPNLFRLATIGVIGMSSAVFWSTIKAEYREFLNQGTSGQVVLVSTEEQISMLKSLAETMNLGQLSSGFDQLVNRTAYVEYFGGAILTVPSSVPHEDGKLWGEALQHVLTPRILVPSKKAINDSDRTNAYSGVSVPRGEDGSSISLGYVAESYIDFGPVGMLVPLFFCGLFVGWGYRLLTKNGRCSSLLSGFAAALLVQYASTLEQSNLKLVGKLVLGFAAIYIVNWQFGARLEGLLLRPVEEDSRRV